jgi:hypothetical protein
MSDPFRGEKIANWVGDFCDSERAARVGAAVQPVASAVLAEFLSAACARRDVEPDEIDEADVRFAMVEGIARLDIPDAARRRVPALVGAFLGELEAQGRLGGGRALGAFARAHRGAYESSARPAVAPIRREASKLGPNDPCPCGSGKKFKKCCRHLGR